MTNRIFSAKFLRDELGLPYDGDVVLDKITSTGRWEIHHRLIFKYEDKLWQTTYSVGATEYQDVRPWEHDKNVICHEVEPYEKTIIGYRRVSKD
jgi:hypothetical protein